MKKAPLSQGCSKIGHNRLPGQQEGGWAPRTCPECGKLFEPNVRNQLFCTPKHNTDWNNRAGARGKVLAPLAFAARATRNGTQGPEDLRQIGRRASNAQNRLIREWRDEDRAAGRMDATTFLRQRVKHGLFDLP